MTGCRCRCSVPFCKRFIREEGGRWICPTHWRALPLKRRKAYQRATHEREPDFFKAWKKKPRWMARRPERVAEGPRPRSAHAPIRLYDRLERQAIALAMQRMM